MLKRFLRSPDPAEGGQNPPTGPNPPAAEVVTKSGAKEQDAGEIVDLRRKLVEKDNTIKQRETRLSELEDENRQLKAIPAPKPGKEKPEQTKEGKAAWWAGL